MQKILSYMLIAFDLPANVFLTLRIKTFELITPETMAKELTSFALSKGWEQYFPPMGFSYRTYFIRDRTCFHIGSHGRLNDFMYQFMENTFGTLCRNDVGLSYFAFLNILEFLQRIVQYPNYLCGCVATQVLKSDFSKFLSQTFGTTPKIIKTGFQYNINNMKLTVFSDPIRVDYTIDWPGGVYRTEVIRSREHLEDVKLFLSQIARDVKPIN